VATNKQNRHVVSQGQVWTKKDSTGPTSSKNVSKERAEKLSTLVDSYREHAGSYRYLREK
jgi:hypothetical protein